MMHTHRHRGDAGMSEVVRLDPGLPSSPAERAAAAQTGSERPAPLTTRTRRLLEDPIAPTLLRLAAPTVVVMIIQALVSAAEAVFVGWLGAEALAGVSLVFPLIMLMQTMSAGGMGGGVASAVARALGAGRRDDADALAGQALLIAIVMGGLFTTGALWAGPTLYRALGGAGGALAVALAYSNVVFAGASAFWVFNILASVVRGAGNMLLPAGIVVGGAAVTLAVSPALIVGWGPIPRLGVVGAATALVAYYALGSLLLLGYLASGRGPVRLSVADLRIRRSLLADILRVGLPGSLNTIQTNLTVVFLTGLVGPFGTFALAGYGMGARLEYLLIPLVFGLGSALVTMVGTNVGAGQLARAQRIAWVGAALAGAVTGGIGFAAAVVPRAWLGLFTEHPEILGAGTSYLERVGPVYGFLGVGLALYFASQGAGRVFWPLVAGFVRLLTAVVGGWLAIDGLGAGLPGLFLAIALSLVVFGTTVTVAIGAGAWRSRASTTQPSPEAPRPSIESRPMHRSD
jgi:putative MATE family efflux protein